MSQRPLVLASFAATLVFAGCGGDAHEEAPAAATAAVLAQAPPNAVGANVDSPPPSRAAPEPTQIHPKSKGDPLAPLDPDPLAPDPTPPATVTPKKGTAL